MTTWTPTVQACDEYMAERQGRYEQRAVRYRAAADWLYANGLTDHMTIVDIGAGMTEFDYCLRVEYNWRGRYIGVDGGFDGTDLNNWTPKRTAHFYVGLEILEHLQDPYDVAQKMQQAATVGVVITTPDGDHCDVLGMDPTHTMAISAARLQGLGFNVESKMLYGGYYSNGRNDSIFGTWKR